VYESRNAEQSLATLDWTPSIYFAESWVQCPLDFAWEVLLDYEAWNPTFVGAQVQPVKGERRKVGEIVLIKKQLTYANGEPLPEFYAETVAVIAPRRIIWYVHPAAGHSFRNFVDFGLSEVDRGVRFNINYYAQSARYGELTEQQRQALQQERLQSVQSLQHTADAFKQYCEARLSRR
jgi:hypothetical protein